MKAVEDQTSLKAYDLLAQGLLTQYHEEGDSLELKFEVWQLAFTRDCNMNKIYMAEISSPV
jgi:hypothetical protein